MEVSGTISPILYNYPPFITIPPLLSTRFLGLKSRFWNIGCWSSKSPGIERSPSIELQKIFWILKIISLTIIPVQTNSGDVVDFLNSLKKKLLRVGSVPKRVIFVYLLKSATAHELLLDPLTGMRQNRKNNTIKRHQRLLQRIGDSSPPKHFIKILACTMSQVGHPFDIPAITLIKNTPVSPE